MVMRYSVVIPVWNGAETIAETLASVLAQDPPPAQVVVVDDGSQDATPQVLAGLSGPIRVIRQDNQGPGAATTRGLAEVDTPLVATLDADDLWLPGKIARQSAILAADPAIAAVFCPLANFRDDPATADFKGARGGWSRSTMLIRRDAVLRIGPIIDPPGRAGEMVDWFARAAEQGLVLHMMPEVLALRRIRPGSLTYGNAGLAASYLQVARAALLRRRNGGGA